VMLARDMSTLHPNSTFVVDVKSTGLYVTDPVLIKNGVKADYWKTGHSYMKRRTHEKGALAGFEKSGHYFFNKPFGRGYDDGLVSALAICDMMDRNPGKKMSELKDALPKTWGSPTMSPHCDDEKKYGVVDAVVKHFESAKAKGEKVDGQAIRDLVTVNGVRVTVADGTWGLVRASSNKPELVVVVESPVSEARMREMFKAVDGVLRTHPEVGAYNQTICERPAFDDTILDCCFVIGGGYEGPAICCVNCFCLHRNLAMLSCRLAISVDRATRHDFGHLHAG
jgi:phosphomannomutase / phosphoglucomutase